MKLIFLYGLAVFGLFFLFGCDTKEDETSEVVIDQVKRVYFDKQEITVNRSNEGPVSIRLRYEGPATTELTQIEYDIIFPSENNAVEGEDFELPQSTVFTITNGQAFTDIVLIQRILFNENAVANKFLTFELKDKAGFITNNSTGDGGSVIVNIAIGDEDVVSNDLNDPDDFIGDKKFTITAGGNRYKIPYFSNVDDVQDTNNANIKRAVVVLQGARRNAGSYYRSMLGAAEMESDQLDTLLIISPQLLVEGDIDQFKLDEEHLYWSSGWRSGSNSLDESSNPRADLVSSYTVLDSLMVKLSEYPSLKKITFTGHSAGGQYVNRYAASSPIADVLNTKGVALSFIVNNPSSYVYMDGKRKVQGTQNTFEVPVNPCGSYNEYKYGLENLPPYLVDNGGGDAIRQRLLQRKVTYLIGQNDNDPNANLLDKDCEAILQGTNRFDRAQNYFDHLLDYYGPAIEENQKIGVVPGVGHSSRGMFQSEKGRQNAFRN